MKKTLLLCLGLFVISVTACTPRVMPTPLALLPTETTVPVETQAPAAFTPTVEEPAASTKLYENPAFGLSFRYPAGWFGPDEYVSDQVLRLEVGSDTVYPYGTDRTEQIYTVKNAYYVLIQYAKNDQNQVWHDTYQSLANLQDGESLSGARSLIIRERQVELGSFSGFEYISTLSETAQTEPVYIRQIILIDDQSNVLTISGMPNNVDLSSGANWRAVYQAIDEENRAIFHEVFESLTIQ